MKTLFILIIGSLFGISNQNFKTDKEKFDIILGNEEETMHQIDILFLYGNYNGSESSSDNITTQEEIQTKVSKLINESNNILGKSHVNMYWNSVGIEEVKLSKTLIERFFYEILNSNRLNNYNSRTYPELKKYFDLRYRYNADAIVYIDIKNAKRPSNSANVVSGKYNPYVRLNNGDANTNTFMHELGHVFGLTHEMGSTVPYEIDKSGYKTIMASNCTQSATNFNKSDADVFSGEKSSVSQVNYFSKCNWDAVSVLNERAQEISNWSKEVRPGQNANYEKAPSIIREISAINNCVTWAIDEFNRLWIWDRYEWEEVKTERRFTHVSAKNYDTAFLVDTQGTFISYDNYTKVFGMINTDEKVERIATNSSGKIYMLGKSEKIYEWKRFSGRDIRWVEIPSQNNKFIDVELSGNGSLWAVSKFGQILQYEHNNWVIRSKRNVYVQELSVGEDGTVVYLDQNKEIFIAYDNSFFFNPIKNNVPSWCNCSTNTKRCDSIINKNRAVSISVFTKDRIWALASDYTYKYVGNNGFQEVYEFGQWRRPKYTD